MPSETVHKENDISKEAKNMVENSIAETNKIENSTPQKTKLESEVQINEKTEPSKDLSESENKENEEPSVEDIESQKNHAEELLADGKRHFVIKDFQLAADVLSDACNLFGTIFGEMAEECAEVYYMYGCALLELTKDQISPVGLEEKDEEENEDVCVDQEENSAETDKKVTNGEDKQATNLNTLEKIEIAPSEEKKILEAEESSEAGASADEEEKPDEDIEEDDVNDLQVAWEMLDLAKVIYKRMDTEESKLKLAEVLMKCGEVSIEDEKFETAIEDMTESLEIRRLLLPEDSRIIAETLFQLGIAQELSGSGERAIELLTEAAAVLDQRILNLNNLTDENDDEKTKEEVVEIKAIIPEIREKIVDIKERKKAVMSALMAAVSGVNELTTNGGGSSTSKQVSNISHLVRKRPKQGESDETPNKVPKVEESTTVKQ